MAESSEHTLKWRELLVDVCRDLLQENVENMKFICGAELPGGSLERCTDGLKLVTLLIENVKISEQDCSYLIRLLDRCGRTDLSQRLHDEMPKTRDSDDQERNPSAVLRHSQSSPRVSSGTASADIKPTLPHSSSLGSAGDFEQLKKKDSRSSGGRQGQSYDMSEGEVVKELRKEGIECLFTNPFLLNAPSSLKSCRERFSKDLKNEAYARRYPLMNLVGYLNFKVEKQNVDILFKDILKEKPDNLLALLNLVFIYDHLKLSSKARQCEQQVVDILKGSCSSVIEAQAKYELAEILTAVDAHKQKGGESKIKQLFQEALSCEGVQDYEKMEWNFAYAFFYFKVDSLKGKTCQDYFVKSMKHFYKVVTATPSSADGTEEAKSRIDQRMKDMVSKAWCFMGNLLSRCRRNKVYNVLAKIPEMECLPSHSRITLSECLEKAKETWSEQNKPVILRRFGVSLLDEDMALAKDCLLQALSIKEDGYGYSLMGRWNLEKYNKSNKQEEYLDEAIKYFEMAEKFGCDLWHLFRNFAEALKHKGNYVGALSYCEKAKECGGKYDSELFNLQAEVLDKCGENDKATEMRDLGEKVESRDFDEKYDFGWIYCEDDANKIGHITQRLEGLKDCSFSIFYVRRDTCCGEDSLVPWEKINEKCNVILVYCSEAFYKSPSVAKATLTSIAIHRCKLDKLDTIVRIVEQGTRREAQSPFPILDNAKVLEYDDCTFYEKMKSLKLR